MEHAHNESGSPCIAHPPSKQRQDDDERTTGRTRYHLLGLPPRVRCRSRYPSLIMMVPLLAIFVTLLSIGLHRFVFEHLVFSLHFYAFFHLYLSVTNSLPTLVSAQCRPRWRSISLSRSGRSTVTAGSSPLQKCCSLRCGVEHLVPLPLHPLPDSRPVNLAVCSRNAS